MAILNNVVEDVSPVVETVDFNTIEDGAKYSTLLKELTVSMGHENEAALIKHFVVDCIVKIKEQEARNAIMETLKAALIEIKS